MWRRIQILSLSIGLFLGGCGRGLIDNPSADQLIEQCHVILLCEVVSAGEGRALVVREIWQNTGNEVFTPLIGSAPPLTKAFQDVLRQSTWEVGRTAVVAYGVEGRFCWPRAIYQTTKTGAIHLAGQDVSPEQFKAKVLEHGSRTKPAQ